MTGTDQPSPGEGPATDFEALYHAEWTAILSLGWTLTGSWTAAEELAQEAFIDAYRRWERVGGMERPGAWVRRAVVNRSGTWLATALRAHVPIERACTFTEMGRIRRSWDIAKQSAVILRTDKELVTIPLFGLVVTLLVVAAFGGAAWFTLTETVEVTGTSYEPSGLTYAVGVAGYLALSIVATYFTAALVSGAHQRLTGSDPSLATAFAGANRRLPQVIGWALLAGTVGLILQVIAERGFIGRMVANLLSFGWQVLTFLAVPVVVVEGLGPIASLKRCTDLFRRTWGENLTAQLGFGLIGFLAALPGLALAVLIGLAVPVVGIAVGVVWVAVVSLVISALNGIFRAALYQYATTGEVPGDFSADAITGAFAPRSGTFG